MINEKVSLKEVVTVQLIKGVIPEKIATNKTTLNGCGIPEITMNREVFGINVKGEKNEVK